MRIFLALMIIIAAVFLFFIPIEQGIYDFRTQVREDSFNDVDTAVGVTTANVTLFRPIYDSDTDTIDILSDLSTDSPAYSSYNSTTRVLLVSGLTANTTRGLDVSYDISSMTESTAMDNFFNTLPFLWMVCAILFAPMALAALFLGR